MSPKPGWIADRGELVRAHRIYTGLSQRTFAERCGLREKSLSDIEIGRRDMPEGFLDTVAEVVSKFDDEVEQVIRKAESIIGGDERHAIEFRVTDNDNDEWTRAVIGRAAVTSEDLILPILDGIHQQEDRAG